MPNTLLFTLIFISQIGLISIFYPRKLTARLNFVIANYPPETHPKLYPESVERLLMIKSIYMGFNYFMVFIGLCLLYAFSFSPLSDNFENDFMEHIPLLYGMLQFIPLASIEYLGRRQLKLMRDADTRRSRTASLSPRKLTNYVSPWLVGAAVMVFIGFISFELYIANGMLDEDFWIKIFSVSLSNAIFISIIVWHLNGKKLDPYQANKDRIRNTRFTITSALSVSIFVSLFISAQTLVNYFNWNYLEIIINSLYFQIIAICSLGSVLGGLKFDDIDFSVYQ